MEKNLIDPITQSQPEGNSHPIKLRTILIFSVISIIIITGSIFLGIDIGKSQVIHTSVEPNYPDQSPGSATYTVEADASRNETSGIPSEFSNLIEFTHPEWNISFQYP